MADATLLFGFKHEWDIAAGAAIVEAAGGCVTDLWGEPLIASTSPTRARRAQWSSGAALHPLLIERTAHFSRSARRAEGT